jgi:methionine synthase II (cobalamin-independent)
MKQLVILIIGFFLSVAAFAQTKQLKSFDELMDALKTGKEVRMVVYYSKCKQISDNEEKEKSPDAIGGMKIDVYEYFAQNAVKNKKAFVVFSESKLIEYPKGDEGYVYNYVKVRVFEDNTVKITARYIDSKTFEDKMDENFFGDINDGKNDKGVYFYID